jgi:hypothetical protein
VSIGAIIVMPLLARAKNRVAGQLDSRAVSGDAAQSWLCAIAAAGVLVSILANAALGWWWLDPIIGLGIAGLAVHEAREAWAGEVCSDCAPVGFNPASAPTASKDVPCGQAARKEIRQARARRRARTCSTVSSSVGRTTISVANRFAVWQ